MDDLWSAGRALGRVLHAPFAALPPLGALLALALTCAVLALVAFRLTTPQRHLRRVKDRLWATVYEMRVFSASPRRVLAAQGRALGLTLLYLLCAAPALLVLTPVLGPLLVEAAVRYERAPLTVGEPALLSLELRRPVPRAAIRIQPLDAGIEIVPPLVMLRAPEAAHLRLIPRHPGRHRLRIEIAGARLEQELVAGDGGAIPPAASGPVRQLTIDYPAETARWIGLPWYVHLLGLSMVVALVLRRRLGVVL